MRHIGASAKKAAEAIAAHGIYFSNSLKRTSMQKYHIEFQTLEWMSFIRTAFTLIFTYETLEPLRGSGNLCS